MTFQKELDLDHLPDFYRDRSCWWKHCWRSLSDLKEGHVKANNSYYSIFLNNVFFFFFFLTYPSTEHSRGHTSKHKYVQNSYLMNTNTEGNFQPVLFWQILTNSKILTRDRLIFITITVWAAAALTPRIHTHTHTALCTHRCICSHSLTHMFNPWYSVSWLSNADAF